MKIDPVCGSVGGVQYTFMNRCVLNCTKNSKPGKVPSSQLDFKRYSQVLLPFESSFVLFLHESLMLKNMFIIYCAILFKMLKRYNIKDY